jgi:hypothetical protein
VTLRELFEQICQAARDELENSRSELEGIGLSWTGPEIVVDPGSPTSLTAELLIVFYRDNDLVDLFEFHVCWDGNPVVSVDEVRLWLRENIPDVLEKRGLPE